MNLPKPLAQFREDLDVIRSTEEKIRQHAACIEELRKARNEQIAGLFRPLTPVIAVKSWSPDKDVFPKGIVVGFDRKRVELKVIVDGEMQTRRSSWENWEPYEAATGGKS